MAEPFATAADLEVRWRPLSGDEQATAAALLTDASAIVRSEVKDIDERITLLKLDKDIVRAVVCSMVKRAMVAGLQAGVSAQQQSAGPFAQSLTFTNPAGDLYLTRAERRRLGGVAARAFEIDTRPARSGNHADICTLNFGGNYCSCGAVLTEGLYPLYETGGL